MVHARVRVGGRCEVVVRRIIEDACLEIPWTLALLGLCHLLELPLGFLALACMAQPVLLGGLFLKAFCRAGRIERRHVVSMLGEEFAPLGIQIVVPCRAAGRNAAVRTIA